jgi:acyl carrier protein
MEVARIRKTPYSWQVQPNLVDYERTCADFACRRARERAEALVWELSEESVAPETDPASVSGDADLRDALDIDSMDFFKFIVGLHDSLGGDVPQRDYPLLSTLDGAMGWVRARLGETAPAQYQRESTLCH